MKSNSFAKKHPKITLVFFNIALLLFIFMILEIVLRIFTPDWLAYRMKYLNTGNLKGFGTDAGWQLDVKNGEIVSFKPDQIFKIYNYEYENTVHINSMGARSTSANEVVDTNNIIPFTGDSFVFGLGVEDNENLVALTKKSTGYNFLNLGFPGTCIIDQRRMIGERYDALHHPQVVVFGFFLGNDFEDIIKGYSKKTSKPDSNIVQKDRAKLQPPPVEQNGFGWKLNKFVSKSFLRSSYAIQFIKQKILNIKNKGKAKEMNWAFYTMDSSNIEHLNLVKKYVDLEIKMLSEEKYKPVVIIIPDKYQMDSSIRKSMCSYYNISEKNMSPFLPNKIITEALERYKIKYIDPTQCLLNHLKDGPLYYTGDDHFTRLGQKIISECINDSLQNLIKELSAGNTKVN